MGIRRNRQLFGLSRSGESQGGDKEKTQKIEELLLHCLFLGLNKAQEVCIVHFVKSWSCSQWSVRSCSFVNHWKIRHYLIFHVYQWSRKCGLREMKWLAAFHKVWMSCLHSLSIGFPYTATRWILSETDSVRVLYKEFIIKDSETTRKGKRRK